MTVSTSSSTTTIVGNNSTTVFSFNFIGVAPSDIAVIYTDANGNQTTLTSSQYTLTLNAPATGALWGVGGTVTYLRSGAPIATGTSITILRTVPLTQLTTISNEGNFYPQVVESALDTLCFEIQQVAARTGLFTGSWATGITYHYSDIVVDGANGANTANYYLCVQQSVSGVWATDLANGLWTLIFNVQAVAGYATTASTAATNAAASATNASTSATTATTQAATATTQATNAAASATSASASATAASNYSLAYSGTSATSVTIGTGAQSFTASAGKLWVAGQYLQIASNANAANYMHGTVTSYNTGTGALVTNITDTGGSGTKTDWNISISGTQGPTGVVSETGSPAAGNLTKFSSPTAITNADLTGDVTTSGGVATTIAANAVTNVKAAQMAALTVKSNATNATANAGDLALAATQLFGCNAGGTALSGITLGTGLSMASTTLNATAGVVTVKRQSFTSSGTYTPSTGMLYCDIEVYGGGGGGGGTAAVNGAGAGGGGSGGYSKALATAATVGASKAVTIGAAGAAGAASSSGTGGTGGTTSVGTICVATGGLGGQAGNSWGIGGAGATVSGATGDQVAGGSPGSNASTGSTFDASGGGGGRGAGAGQFYLSPAAGIAALANSGGGGGGGVSGGTSVAGGAGGSGYVIITEYCSQ